mmetsp:Transcript_81508/g.225758  ORF Transcript_81508/g.225758 Transcript_81508/m.225758 type:complete len:203 (-) Transcript_81508:1087-1695(-)
MGTLQHSGREPYAIGFIHIQRRKHAGSAARRSAYGAFQSITPVAFMVSVPVRILVYACFLAGCAIWDTTSKCIKQRVQFSYACSQGHAVFSASSVGMRNVPRSGPRTSATATSIRPVPNTTRLCQQSYQDSPSNSSKLQALFVLAASSIREGCAVRTNGTRSATTLAQEFSLPGHFHASATGTVARGCWRRRRGRRRSHTRR